MDADAAARPRFKSSVRPVVDAEDGLFLFTERRHAWMSDRVYAALAPMLDGTREVETIFSALVGQYDSAEVFSALDALRAGGFLAEDTAAIDLPARAFWEEAGVRPAEAGRRLALASVSVLALGDVDGEALSGLLARDGVGLSADGHLVVILTDDYLHPALAEFNERALSSGHPWLLVKPVGVEPWIGPAFEPGQTACWECLAHRLRWHRRVERHVAERTGTRSPGAPAARLPSAATASLAQAAAEITRWIGSGGSSVLADRVVATSTLTFERTHHRLTRRPQCPACGQARPADGGAAGPFRFEPRPKVHTSDGGHRTTEPLRALELLELHLSPITGIVGALDPGSRTGPSAEGVCVTPTFAADHNFSDMHNSRFFLRDGMRRRSGGKGKTAAQARASALAESLERYSGVFDGTEPQVRARLAELGDAAIRPNDCTCYSERQFAERATSVRRAHKAHWVPEPFRDDASIEWTPVWSLTDERTRYLPTSYCYYGYCSGDPLFARADSNGCAAGTVPEEAVLQGLLELVERDAVAIWWYNRLPRQGIDLSTASDPYAARLQQHYRALCRELWVLDITSDLGIPTFAALSRRTDQAEEDIIYGFGCHLDPSVALTRALTEMNQSLEAVPSAADPATFGRYLGDADARHWWRNVKAGREPWLLPRTDAQMRPLNDIADLASDDLARDVQGCVERASGLGIEVLVLDQTRPDIGLPVVRVVAPGLRHFWARYGPGRLYDVPVRMGLIDRPTGERDLNPFVVHF